jgi:hypothetical protein
VLASERSVSYASIYVDNKGAFVNQQAGLRELLLARLLLLVLLAASLGACSLSPFVIQGSIDSNNTVEDVTTTVLVTNILRARDQAPLFFSDISQLRGSLNLSLSAQESFPWGPLYKPMTATGVRRSGQTGPLVMSTNPTYDIAPLNTKQFTQGLLSSVSETVFGDYINRVSPRITFQLFVQKIDRYERSGETSLDSSNSGYYEKISYWTDKRIHKMKVVITSSSHDFGPKVMVKAKDVLDAKTAGLSIKAIMRSGTVQFQDRTTNAILCVPNDGDTNYIAVGIVSVSTIKLSEATTYEQSNKACVGGAEGDIIDPQPVKYLAHLRTVEGMFYYLGAIMNDDNPEENLFRFHIYDHPISDFRLSVSYRGRQYYIPNWEQGEGSRDYTIGILGVLNDAVNLNRDASELPTTKATQAVGGG